MPRIAIPACAFLLTGCLGLRSSLDEDPEHATVDHTNIEVWARLPGVRATVGTFDMVLPGGPGTTDPPIDGHGLVLRLESPTDSLERSVSFEAAYALGGIQPLEVPITDLDLEVMRAGDGQCVLGATNVGTAAGRGWASDYTTPIAPCGPWDLDRIVLANARRSLELDVDARVLRRGAETASVAEPDVARAVAAAMEGFESFPMGGACDPAADFEAIELTFPLETVGRETTGCTRLEPVRAALRELELRLLP